VADLPTYDDLRHVDRTVLWGLLEETGTPAWTATGYEHRWESGRATWSAVVDALGRAARGDRPGRPRSTPPRWLGPLVRELLTTLSTSWSQGEAFRPVRLLERLGLVELAVDDTYILALVSGLGDRWNRDDRATDLRGDPGLVERALWRVFEVEGGGEVSLANVDKFSRPEGTWQHTFRTLVGDGTLPRERVLTACLDALQRDFSAYRAGWFASTYAALEPSTDEQARHQERYRRLVRSSVTATVSMAVRRLRALGRTGRLDDEEVATALGPALLSPVKGTAVDAVRLLADVAARRPDLGSAVCAAVAAALDHPHADVQEAAARLLERHGAGAVVRERAATLEPTVQRLLGGPVLAPPADGRSPVGTSSPVGPAPPEATTPATGADLLGRLAALLEGAGDPFEVELVLAGLAACPDPVVLAPLRRRAAAVLGRGPREGVQRGWLRGQLARLVLAAAGETPQGLPFADVTQAFLGGRLAEVERVLAGADPPFAPLATPDSPSGWVDPRVLVGRLAAEPRPRHHDLVAALLRLGADGRVEALAGSGVAGPVGAVLRHALGGGAGDAGDVAGRSEVPVAWWVAASRARAPLEPDDALLRAGLAAAGQGRPIDARVVLHGRPGSYEDERGRHAYTIWGWEVVVEAAAATPMADQPTAVPGREFAGWGVSGAEDWVALSATVWPHDAEHVLVGGVDPVLNAAASTEVSHDAVRVLDMLLRHPGRMGTLAAETVAAGLAAHGRDQRARAVDLVLALVPAGRLGVDDLAAAMTRQAGLAVATRWAASLRDVALASPVGSGTVVTLLCAVLPGLDAGHRGLHALLDVLHQEVLRGPGVVPDRRTQEWLRGLTGSSRAARTARDLLSLGQAGP
jgi:hypothetical protein